MATQDLRPEYQRLHKLIKDRLTNGASCSDVVAAYEEFIQAVWYFAQELLGSTGTKAVMARAIALIAQEKPLATTLVVLDDGIDFSRLREHVAKEACEPDEIVYALTATCISVLQTLSNLAGEALVYPFLRNMEEKFK